MRYYISQPFPLVFAPFPSLSFALRPSCRVPLLPFFCFSFLSFSFTSSSLPFLFLLSFSFTFSPLPLHPSSSFSFSSFFSSFPILHPPPCPFPPILSPPFYYSSFAFTLSLPSSISPSSSIYFPFVPNNNIHSTPTIHTFKRDKGPCIRLPTRPLRRYLHTCL